MDASSKKNRLGVVLVLVMLVALLTMLLVIDRVLLWRSGASTDGISDVKVYNKSPNSFSVFWISNSQNSFLWGENDLNRTTEIVTNGRLKRVTVVGLKEGTGYKFKILPGEIIYTTETKAGNFGEIKNIEIEDWWGEGMYFIRKLGGDFLGVYTKMRPVFNVANLFGEVIRDGDKFEVLFFDQGNHKSEERVAKFVNNGIVLKRGIVLVDDSQSLEDVLLDVNFKTGKLGECGKDGNLEVSIEGENGDNRQYNNIFWSVSEGGSIGKFRIDLAGFGRQGFDLSFKIPRYLEKRVENVSWRESIDLTSDYLLVGDVDGNNKIDGVDFTKVKNEASKFSQVEVGYYLAEDLDGSCQVNNIDLALMVRSLQLMRQGN